MSSPAYQWVNIISFHVEIYVKSMYGALFILTVL